MAVGGRGGIEVRRYSRSNETSRKTCFLFLTRHHRIFSSYLHPRIPGGKAIQASRIHKNVLDVFFSSSRNNDNTRFNRPTCDRESKTGGKEPHKQIPHRAVRPGRKIRAPFQKDRYIRIGCNTSPDRFPFSQAGFGIHAPAERGNDTLHADGRTRYVYNGSCQNTPDTGQDADEIPGGGEG